MFRCKKGEYKYITNRKYQQLTLAVLMAVIGVFIYLAGYFISGRTNANICTVLGMLMVLPGAKFLVSYILLFPYKTPALSLYDEAKKASGTHGLLLSDIVMTSPEKAMNLNFLWIGSQCVYGSVGKAGQDINYIQDYLKNGIRNWSSGYTVKICHTQKEFLKTVQNTGKKEADTEEEERVKAYLYSLIV